MPGAGVVHHIDRVTLAVCRSLPVYVQLRTTTMCRQPSSDGRCPPGLAGSSRAQRRRRARAGHDAVGNAASTEVRWNVPSRTSGIPPALEALAEARTVAWCRSTASRIRARPEPLKLKKGSGVVRGRRWFFCWALRVSQRMGPRGLQLYGSPALAQCPLKCCRVSPTSWRQSSRRSHLRPVHNRSDKSFCAADVTSVANQPANASRRAFHRIECIGRRELGIQINSGACFVDFGHEVIRVDKDESKIVALRRGEMPIFEPGARYARCHQCEGREIFRGR